MMLQKYNLVRIIWTKILKLRTVGRPTQMLISILICPLGFWSERWNWKPISRNHRPITSFCLRQVITRWENYPSLPTSASSRLHFHYDLSVVYQRLAWGFHKHSQALRFLFEQTDLNQRKKTNYICKNNTWFWCTTVLLSPWLLIISVCIVLNFRTNVQIIILCGWLTWQFGNAYNIYLIFHF